MLLNQQFFQARSRRMGLFFGCGKSFRAQGMVSEQYVRYPARV